jgi:hypothetical protein
MTGKVGMRTKTMTAWGFTDRTGIHSFSPLTTNCTITRFGRDCPFPIGFGVESIWSWNFLS